MFEVYICETGSELKKPDPSFHLCYIDPVKG